MKFIFSLVIFYSSLFGANFDIQENLQEAILSKEIRYKIVPQSSTLAPLDILKAKDLQPVKKSGLGMQFDKIVWTKVSVTNSTANARTVYLYNPRAGIDYIDVFLFKDNNLSKTLLLGDSREKNLKEILSRFSTLKLELQANETVELVSKISNPHGRVDISWILMDEYNFYKFLLLDLLVWGIILSGIFFIFILQLFFYSTLKKEYFLNYMLFTVAIFCYLIFYNGFGYLLFDAGIFNNVMTHISGYSILLLYIIFLDKFLPIPRDSKSIKLFLFFAYGSSIYLISTSWVIAYSPIIYQFDDYYFILHIIIIAILIYITFKTIRLNPKISKAILYGQIFTITGYITFALNGLQIIETKSYLQQILGLAVLLEMLFFSYAISQQIKSATQEKEKTEKLIISQSHFSTIGQTLRNIAHQWKVPMVRFGTLLTELEITMIYKNIYDDRTNEVMKLMRNNLSFMSQTIDDFKNFYSKEDHLSQFYPYQIIEDVKMILLEKIQHFHVQIEYHENFRTLKIECSQRSFTHVAMILLDNAIDIAEQRKIEKPIITIKSKLLKDSIEIYFEDNCGGIEEKPIDSIFTIDVTSHHGDNRGSGLSIAKMLVEEKMSGTIKVQNQNDGALFTIRLPLK